MSPQVDEQVFSLIISKNKDIALQLACISSNHSLLTQFAYQHKVGFWLMIQVMLSQHFQ